MHSHENVTEFVIQIGPRIDTYYPVTVLRSPAGTGGNGRFPVRDFLHGSADDAATGAAGTVVTRDVDTDDEPRVRLPSEQVGRDLYDALFTGEIAALFERSLGRTTMAGERLRVRLHLNVGNESIAPLATLPWELMFRRDRRSFLSLSPDTTFVRSLDVPIDLYEPRQITGPVKVLFVMSNPKGDLNLGAERAAIEAGLAEEFRTAASESPLVAEFLENATFAALEDRLHRDDFAIIHFMGHGALSGKGDGALLFHDGLRSGRDLGELLKEEPTTRLVMLNACNTGAASTATGADPFAGVATALVMAGVPSVIAMQFPVSDDAAIAFSTRLYSEIARGRSIEASVDSGRRKIKAMRPDQHEWATPVLFLRDPTLSPMGSSRRGAREAGARTPAPTGEVIVTQAVPAASREPARGSATPAGSSAATSPIPTVAPVTVTATPAAPPVLTRSVPPGKTSAFTGKRIAIAALALVVVVAGVKLSGGGTAEQAAVADTTAAATDTTQAASDSATVDAPFAAIAFDGFAANVAFQHLVMHDTTAAADLSTTLEVDAGESITFDAPFTITKTPGEGCEADGCPVRLHLAAMPPVDGENVCHPTTFRTEEGTAQTWSGTFKAPLSAGRYPIAIIMTPGDRCNTPEDPGNTTTLMTLIVR